MQVTLKLASSLDGRIATRTGESQWITGPEARQIVHELRACHEAVLVGVGTLLADDPMLDARNTNLPLGRQPHRIVLDTRLRTPAGSNFLRMTEATAFLICADDAKASYDLTQISNLKLVRTPLDESGRIDIREAIRQLETDFGVRSVFVEGGGMVAASFLKLGLVDRMEWFRAPLLIGGDGVPALGSLDVAGLDEGLRFRRVDVRSVGQDIWETYEK